MTNEPNNEQARELSEKELEGIAGGEWTYKDPRTSYIPFGDMFANHEGIMHDHAEDAAAIISGR